MTIGAGNLILASDYNTIQATVASILGVGSGQTGYGQTVSSSPVIAGNTITAAQMQNLKSDLDKIAYHQNNAASTVPSITAGGALQASDWASYSSQATSLNNTRFTLSTSASQSTQTTGVNPTFSNWTGRKNHSVTVDFGTADAGRYFFNTGGEIRITPSQSGNTNLLSLGGRWSSLFSTVKFNYANWYAMTNLDQQVYITNDTGIYSGNTFKIIAKSDVTNNSTGTARYLYLTIVFIDTGVAAFVDGTTTSTVSYYRATGSYISVPASLTVSGSVITNLALPTVPLNVTATVTGTTATLNWNAPSDNGGSAITQYNITWASGSTTTTNTTATISGLDTNTVYTFSVSAVTNAGTGPAQTSSSITTQQTYWITTLGGSIGDYGQGIATDTNGQVYIVGYTNNQGSGSSDFVLAKYNGSGSIQWQRTLGIATSDIGYGVATDTSGNVYIVGQTVGQFSSRTVANSNTTSTVSAAVPDAPTIGTATATGTTTATVAFTAPANNGGATITSYTATSSPGNITGTVSQAGSGTITVTGLTTGTAYTFTVKATNSTGSGTTSAASNSITTYSVPVNTVAPAVSGTTTVGQTLTTTTGTWTGVPTPTYAYQWQRAGVNISGATSSTYTLVSADVGSAIRCVITATNVASNTSANSNATASITAVVPDAPTIGTATATGTTTATVAFTAPASNGGATITSYTATSTPGNITGTVSQAGSGTITVSGLTTGTAYTFTVKATNSIGTSVASAASNSITTYSLPVNTVAPAVSGTATVGQTLTTTTGTWTGTPANFAYAYQWQRAGVNISGATSSTYTLVSADAGSAIRCVITATNSAGNTTANSNATASITAVVPDAPTIGTATATGGTTATVAFTAPASNGGATITSYTATSTPGNITGTLSQAGSGTITVSGLTTGTAYTFTVKATNSIGTSVASAASNSITTYSTPVNTVSPVVTGTATVGQTLTTTTGTWSGATPITYTYQWQRAGVNISGATSSTYTLVSADAGSAIRCVVTATNSAGNTSANSNATSAVAASVPGIPQSLSTSSITTSSATLSWSAPASNGGSAITQYNVSWSGGSSGNGSTTSTGTSVNITGLASGNTYTFTVTATNSVGTGTAASSSFTTTAPYRAPGFNYSSQAVSINSVSASSVTVSWPYPADGGSYGVSRYRYIISGGSFGGGGDYLYTNGNSATITGLASYTSYGITVWAVDSLDGSGTACYVQFTTPVASGTASFTTPGSYSWIAPRGANSSFVVIGGGGGGGLGGYNGGSNIAGGGGGGGGIAGNSFSGGIAQAERNYTMTANLTVGSGGNAATACSGYIGGCGTTSSVSYNGTAYGYGGRGANGGGGGNGGGAQTYNGPGCYSDGARGTDGYKYSYCPCWGISTFTPQFGAGGAGYNGAGAGGAGGYPPGSIGANGQNGGVFITYG